MSQVLCCHFLFSFLRSLPTFGQTLQAQIFEGTDVVCRKTTVFDYLIVFFNILYLQTSIICRPSELSAPPLLFDP